MEKAYRHDLIDTTVLLVVVAAMPLIKVLRRWYGVVGASKQLRQWPHTNVARQEHYATAVVLKAADLTLAPLLSLSLSQHQYLDANLSVDLPFEAFECLEESRATIQELDRFKGKRHCRMSEGTFNQHDSSQAPSLSLSLSTRLAALEVSRKRVLLGVP